MLSCVFLINKDILLHNQIQLPNQEIYTDTLLWIHWSFISCPNDATDSKKDPVESLIVIRSHVSLSFFILEQFLSLNFHDLDTFENKRPIIFKNVF